MNISCLDFLQKKNLEENLFVIYGKEPACIFKSKEHIIENSFLDSEYKKIKLDIEEEDFILNFNGSLASQDMFSSSKVLFINFIKNRLNKDVKEKIEYISKTLTEEKNPFAETIRRKDKNISGNVIVVLEMTELKIETAKKEILTNFKKGIFVNCSEPPPTEIFNFLRFILPKKLVTDEQILIQQRQYEGNFSLLLNDMELLKIVNDSKYIENIFSENSVKNHNLIINQLSASKIDSAIEIINYYEKNEPGIIPLLIWLLNRDLQAINMILSRSGSVRKLGIWDSQLASYNKIAKRFNKKKIESALSLLDESDKKFKGFLKGSPWDSLREVVFKFV